MEVAFLQAAQGASVVSAGSPVQAWEVEAPLSLSHPPVLEEDSADSVPRIQNPYSSAYLSLLNI